MEDTGNLKESKEYCLCLKDVPGVSCCYLLLKGLMVSHEDYKEHLREFERVNKVRPVPFVKTPVR